MESLADKIILQALKDAPFEGWSMDSLRRATEICGYDSIMADALFPDGIKSAARHITAFFDAALMAQLAKVDIAPMRVRDRIALAVMDRLDLMAPYRPGLRVAFAGLLRPSRMMLASKTLWGSADKIWFWAGDTATDYNRYTKRALLSGVMTSTTLFWLQDETPRFTATRDFLERRIENIMTIGRVLGKRKAA